MRKLISTFVILTLATVARAQTASIMAIHNSPDPLVDTVDVYLLANNTSTLVADDFVYRQSTGFTNVPAETPIRLVFAGSNSTSIADSLVGFGYNLPDNGKFILIAQGHVQNIFNPNQPFGVKVIANAENTSASSGNKLLVYHGSTDAPAVDISAFTVATSNNPAVLAEAAAYGDNTAYISVPNADYFVNISLPGQDNALFTYAAPLKTLSANGEPLVVFASGYLDPSKNQNGPAFGLFAVLKDGTVIELPLQTTAKLQIVHNAPDALAASVDVYSDVTGSIGLLLDNFEFRKATPFLTVPANKTFNVWIAPANSTSYTQNVYSTELNLPGGVEIVALAQGVIDTAKYENGAGVTFDLFPAITPVSSLEANKVTLTIVHGSTDAPAVDVRVGSATGAKIADNIAFGDATDPIVTDATDIVVNVLPAGGSTVVAAYDAPLSAFGDSAITVMASGFLTTNTPAGKDVGEAFGLFVVTASGRVIALPVKTTSVNTIIDANSVRVYPNPVQDVLTVNSKFDVKAIEIRSLDGRIIANSSNSNTLDISELSNGTYVVTVVTTGGNFNTIVVK